MYQLKGMYAAIPTPFNKDESIDLDGVKTIVNYLVDQGMHGIIAGGSTGEYAMMSTEERKAVIKAACEAGKGKIDLVCGTGCPRACDTIELSNYAADCGADAVLVITPHYMTMTEDMLYDYYKTVAENVKVGVIIYHFSGATSVFLSPTFVQKLAKIENIVGIKNTEDMDCTAKIIGLTQDNDSFNVAIGYDSLALANLASGGDASMGVIHNIVPKTMQKIYSLVQENNLAEATKIMVSLNELIMLTEAEPYPGPAKVALELMGLPGGLPRKPIAPPTDEMRANMKACLIKLGIIEG